MSFKKLLIHFLVALVMFSVLAYAVDYPFTPKANIDMQDYNITNVGEVDGNISWDTLDDFPPDCSAGYYVSGLDDSVTCTDSGMVGSTWTTSQDADRHELYNLSDFEYKNAVRTVCYDDICDYVVDSTNTSDYARKALDAIIELNATGGGTVRTGNGTYWMNDTAISGTWHNIIFEGMGKNVTIIKSVDDIAYVGLYFKMIRTDGDYNTFRKFTINGNQQNNNADPELHCLNSFGDYNQIYDVRFYDCRDGIFVDGGEHNDIYNNYFEKIMEYGIDIRNNAHYTNVYKNHFYNCSSISQDDLWYARYCILIDTSDHCSIERNKINYARYGIAGSGTLRYNSIVYNDINNADYGIVSGTFRYGDISHNIINGYTGYGINTESINGFVSYNILQGSVVGGSENGIYIQGNAYNTTVSFNDLTRDSSTNKINWSTIGESNELIGIMNKYSPTQVVSYRLNHSGIDYLDVDELTVNNIISTSLYDITSQNKVLDLNFNNGSIIDDIVLSNSMKNYHGTNHGATHNSTGGFNDGGAYEFDGDNDYIDVSLIDGTYNSFTYEIWYNRNELNPSDNTNHLFYTSNEALRIRFYNNGANYRIQTAGLTDTQWDVATNHDVIDEWISMAFVYDGAYKYLYENGEYVSKEAATGVTTLATSRIGRSTSTFNGTIDNVRFWNSSLSADKIKSNYETRREGIDSFVRQKDIKVNTTAIYPQNDINYGTHNFTMIASDGTVGNCGMLPDKTIQCS